MKKRIFINLTNHPMSKWGSEQLEAAKALLTSGREGLEVEMVEMPFPQIDPKANSKEVRLTAQNYVHGIAQRYIAEKGINTEEKAVIAIHVGGEFNFTYNFVSTVKKQYYQRIKCYAATTDRNTVENVDGTKTVAFMFEQFRAY